VFGYSPGEHGNLITPGRQQRCSGGGTVVGMASDATLVENEQDLGRSRCLVNLLGKLLERNLLQMTIWVVEECYLVDPEEDRCGAKFFCTDLT
jgi:hypothetical protein